VDRAGAERGHVDRPGGGQVAERLDRLPRSAQLVLQGAAHRRIGLEGRGVTSIERFALGARLTGGRGGGGFLDGVPPAVRSRAIAAAAMLVRWSASAGNRVTTAVVRW